MIKKPREYSVISCCVNKEKGEKKPQQNNKKKPKKSCLASSHCLNVTEISNLLWFIIMIFDTTVYCLFLQDFNIVVPQQLKGSKMVLSVIEFL